MRILRNTNQLAGMSAEVKPVGFVADSLKSIEVSFYLLASPKNSYK